MALSNWDTLALNAKGENCYGEFCSSLGIHVEFYKNWLYVYDQHAWREGGSFVKDVVMQVNEGNVRYQDINILAKRGPKEGIYAVVWSIRDPEYFDFMLGIGCSGYLDTAQEVLKRLNRLEDYEKYAWAAMSNSDGKHAIFNLQTQEEIVYYNSKTKQGIYDEDDSWVGIQKEEIEFLKKEILEPWLEGDSWIRDKVNKNILDNPERFNQGDLYILAATQQDITQAITPIEQSQPPILMQAFKKEVPDEPSGEADPI